jgi:2-haloacid dehalogenase
LCLEALWFIMLDFTRFEFITFDCYGTLMNWEEGILRCLQRVLAAHGKHTEDSTLLRLYGDFEAAAEKGEFHSYREVLQSVVRQFGRELGFTPLQQEVESLPKSLKDWRPWPDTITALCQLKDRFRLAIVSNVDDDLFAATKPQLGVEFDQIVTAQQAQAYKPSLKIFELTLARLGVPANRVLHVGQSVYHDVLPAQSLGMATVWVNRPSARSGVGAVRAAEGRPDLQVSSLEELAGHAQR